MTIKDICDELESIAPLSYQESYDNSGLLVGNPASDVNGALLTLDVTEAVIQEAVDKGCNLVIAHHPLIFSGVKRLTGQTYVERCIVKAIKADVAIYAIHTNLDNVSHGVNDMICEKLGLVNTRILSPKADTLSKLVVYVPENAAEAVRNSMFEAGAGHIGDYSECSFNALGSGTFKGGEGTNPVVGNVGQRHTESEIKVETVVPNTNLPAVINAMTLAHPYEEVAYDLFKMVNTNAQVGSGMIGKLASPMAFSSFMDHLKKNLQTEVIRHTEKVSDEISTIAVCGGSGSFLLGAAMANRADVFITGDYKYHQFFDADGKIVIADVGHYESEQFTPLLIERLLKGKFPNFALHLSEINTNPINYF